LKGKEEMEGSEERKRWGKVPMYTGKCTRSYALPRAGHLVRKDPKHLPLVDWRGGGCFLGPSFVRVSFFSHAPGYY
jgi:hypothetical protein